MYVGNCWQHMCIQYRPDLIREKASGELALKIYIKMYRLLPREVLEAFAVYKKL